MTYAELKDIIIRNNIPEDVELMSSTDNDTNDCYGSEMDGIYYNNDEKLIIFTINCDETEVFDPDYYWESHKIKGFVPLTQLLQRKKNKGIIDIDDIF